MNAVMSVFFGKFRKFEHFQTDFRGLNCDFSILFAKWNASYAVD